MKHENSKFQDKSNKVKNDVSWKVIIYNCEDPWKLPIEENSQAS